MKKRFVVDTNVLVYDYEALDMFQENDLIIPLIVLEELDRLKTRQGSVGQSARKALKHLDRFRKGGCLFDGVKTKGGGIVKVMANEAPTKLPKGFDWTKPDNQILALAMKLKAKDPSIVIVSNDINLRVKADSVGIKAEEYENRKVNVNEVFKGFRILDVSKNVIEEFYNNKFLEFPDHKFFPNECILLKVKSTGQSALSKYDSVINKVVPLYHMSAKPWGIVPRNLEQRFAVELLLSNEIKLISLVGTAGTGKTLLALACGLQKILDEKIYKRLLVARPVIPMGKDIGFLPGSKDEKMQSWMQPITDNLDFLFGADMQKEYSYLYDSKLIQIEALTYIRGRSLPNSFIIIDEAQNLTPREVKTIITRAGENSKIILTGDPYQIDNNYLDESSNGLSYVAQKFQNEPISGHIVLQKGERSELATLAANLL